MRGAIKIDAAPDFYELLRQTADRDGFFIEPFGFHLNLLAAVLAANPGRLLVAHLNGQLLAAILVIFHRVTATHIYGATSSNTRHAMPSYLLHVAAMRMARSRGCTEYDLYGIDAFVGAIS